MATEVLKQGSLVRERDSSEWIIVSIHGKLISRVKRNSLAHIVHGQSSPVMRETLQVVKE